MINRTIFIYFLMLTFNTFGQTIQELEYDLSWHDSNEKDGDKIEKAKKLQEIDPFNFKATDYICRYYCRRKIDSIAIYFDNLIAKYPHNTEPYLLRSELLFLEVNSQDKVGYNGLKVKYLNKGLEFNPKDTIIIFKLAEVYYKDFIYPLEKEKNLEWSIGLENKMFDSAYVCKPKPIKKSTFEHAADSSLNYFYQLWTLKQDKNEIIYFPIRQIECFLNQLDKSPIPKDYEKNFNQCFFPSSYLTNLTDNWECDFTSDYLNEITSGKRSAEFFKKRLTDLKENCLFNKEILPNSTIYRFTWLRTFHHPIVIRIEKNENKIMLYWKVGKGAGGYKPKGLKKSGMKRLSLKDWIAFEKLIKEAGFDSLPNAKNFSMTDGSSWTLERKNSESFKAHDTNSPSKEFSKACLFLLDLSNIKVKVKDIY